MVECGEEPEIDDDEFYKEDREYELLMKTVLTESRHLGKVEPYQVEAQSWRLKDRMKTVSVAIVLCLNLPVDPPDVVKLQPCARLEAWVDPTKNANAIENIGYNLQKAYERWQPKARYKRSLDPTADDIQKLCISLRRNAKEERVLFHYNGHGVPRPTDNGEIWVFNSNYTQYIPLNIYDLQQWMGTPSIYVYDCSHAGKIVNLFKTFSNQDEGKCIQLAACGERQLLPMNPDLPADLFTSCLTTPVKMAIKYYMLQNKNRFLPGFTYDMLDKIPGQISDRRSMMGELNWIFTAITDTIAWNTLPRDLFRKLFRQDLLVASLFRNFLLAERVMRSYNCTPVSFPVLPSTYQHHMWGAWDLALEISLSQLPRILSQEDPGAAYHPSPFFEEQLTSFQVWLDIGSTKRRPPEQLPIVLQVLLSQVYRPRALELLGTFLCLGPWAVNLVLEVGIFPYILKLLQATANELRPLLTLLWAKILAVDPQCKADLVRENGNKYFSNVLRDVSLPVEHRAMAAFVMCFLISDCQEGAAAALQCNILPLCLELLLDDHAPLRQWATICAARTWDQHPRARWEATRDNAPDKLLALLDDPVPEVRAAAAYALGTFIKSLPLGDRSDQGRLINHKIAVSLKNKLVDEASPLVRQEMTVALHNVILFYENPFRETAKQYYREFSEHAMDAQSQNILRSAQDLSKVGKVSPSGTLNWSKTKGTAQNQTLSSSPQSAAGDFCGLLSPQGMRKVGSALSLSSFGVSSLSHEHMYLKVWHSMVALESDPFPAVAKLAQKVTSYMRNKIMTTSQDSNESRSKDQKDQDTTDNKVSNAMCDDMLPKIRTSTPVRKISAPLQEAEEIRNQFISSTITSEFWEWSSNYLMKCGEPSNSNMSLCPDSIFPLNKSAGPLQSFHHEEKWTLGFQKLEEQLFLSRSQEPCEAMIFHPTEPLLVLGHRHNVSVWDIEKEARTNFWENVSNGYGHNTRISSRAVMNAATPHCYLCVGGSDGYVRVWNHAFKVTEDRTDLGRVRTSSLNGNEALDGDVMGSPFLVTAFNALEEGNSFRKDASGLLMSWEQDSSCLVVAGNSDKIRLWDLSTEQKIKDIIIKGVAVSALHSLGSWVAAGFYDGYVRLFDRRISSLLVREWKDHGYPIIKAQIFHASSTSAHIISGATSGEVRLSDLRRSGSVQVRQPGPNIQCMSYHPKAHLFAVGTLSQQISVYHTSGSSVNSIRYYNGIMGQKIGSVNGLCFHPSRVLLASSVKDGTVTVHGLTKR